MTTEEKIAFLQEHASATPSKWREKAEWRQENKEWLRYSQFVAMKMLEKMEAEQMSNAQLADRMGCSQEYVSVVLKGQENLSIDTLLKIQNALGIQILQPMFA